MTSWQQYIWDELPTEAISKGEDTSREFLPAHVIASDIWPGSCHLHFHPEQEPLPTKPSPAPPILPVPQRLSTHRFGVEGTHRGLQGGPPCVE